MVPVQLMEGVMNRSTIQAAFAAALPAALLSGCYVVPLGSEQVDKLVALMEAQSAGAGKAQEGGGGGRRRRRARPPPPPPSRCFSPRAMKPPAPVAPAAPMAQ